MTSTRRSKAKTTTAVDTPSPDQNMASSTSAELVLIHPTGDLDLVLADNLRLRVLSHIMTLSSKVFSVMLSSTYAEGQQTFSTESPGEISLHEDDPQAMKRMCYLLHMQWEKAGLATSASTEFLDICIVCDKYDTISALQPVLRGICMQSVRQNEKDEAGDQAVSNSFDLLAASYLLGDHLSFREISQYLVEHFLLTNARHLTKSAAGVLPDELPWMVATQRSNCRGQLYEDICDLVSSFVMPQPEGKSLVQKHPQRGYDRYSRPELTTYAKLLDESRTWRNSTLSQIGIRLGQYRTANEAHDVCISDNNKSSISFIGLFDVVAHHFEESVMGLCLECCRNGELDAAMTCDGEHTKLKGSLGSSTT